MFTGNIVFNLGFLNLGGEVMDFWVIGDKRWYLIICDKMDMVILRVIGLK